MSLACEHVDANAECEWVFVFVFDSGNMNCNHFHNAISSFVRLLVVLFRHFVAVLNTTTQTKRVKWMKKRTRRTHDMRSYNLRASFASLFVCRKCRNKTKYSLQFYSVKHVLRCTAEQMYTQKHQTILASWKHDNKTNELWIKQKSLHRTQK